MLPVNTPHPVNPGDDPLIYVFHNTLDDQGVCGFTLARSQQPPESACLLVNLAQHTQRVLHTLCQKGILYDRPTTLLALAALRPGDTVIDVGAHVGLLSILGRLAVGATGRVYAFEPMPDTFQRLRDNIAFNGFENVYALPLALDEQPGSAVFHINPANEGESSLLAQQGCIPHPVEVATLDALFTGELEARPRLLKLDVEGVELRVLRGGTHFFAEHAPDLVFCEVNSGALAAGGTSEAELRRFFTERGYRCAVVSNDLPGLALPDNRFYRVLADDEASALPDNAYVYNLMFVRADAGLYPAASL